MVETYSNERLEKFFNSKEFFRDTLVCEECGNNLLYYGEAVRVVAWTPPANAVADSVTFDRQFDRNHMKVFCEKHDYESENAFEQFLVKDGYSSCDVVWFKAEIDSKAPSGYGFRSSQIVRRARPEDE